jgi:hypothetical protein
MYTNKVTKADICPAFLHTELPVILEDVMLLTLACKYLLQRVLGYLLGYQNNWIS